MSEQKIGRVLAASLHQSISELIPTRVEFYENWLTAVRIRQGDLGRARFAAVVSFLRQEGAEYDAIVGRAGRYTADLTVDALPVVERAVLRRLPHPIRVRVVLRLAARMVRGLHDDGRLRVLVRRDVAVVTFGGSVFCDVREPASAPLCRFYGAVLARSLEAFGMSARVQLSRCRATGDGACELIIHIGEPETRPSDAD
jgi:bacteriochlorophyll 4-vinyl reductase